jgi:acetyl-CoA carboxylase biotin carboxyl carrier protein
VQVAAPQPTHFALPTHAPALAAAPAAAPVVDDKAHVVTSPFVGTFYRRPNPDSPNYVSLNDKINKGQVLCIVEAMKLMNEIEADVGGKITAILVDDGAPVEYGQPLFKIVV